MQARPARTQHAAYWFRTAGRCIALAHGDRPASDAEFTALVTQIERVVASEGSVCLLVHAAGDGGPNAKQRASLRPLTSLPMRAGIVSDSVAVRAIVTAISWFIRQPVRAFARSEASAVFGFLELSGAEERTMRRLLSDVCAESGLPILVL